VCRASIAADTVEIGTPPAIEPVGKLAWTAGLSSVIAAVQGTEAVRRAGESRIIVQTASTGGAKGRWMRGHQPLLTTIAWCERCDDRVAVRHGGTSEPVGSSTEACDPIAQAGGGRRRSGDVEILECPV
jgi:hypothetical protein